MIHDFSVSPLSVVRYLILTVPWFPLSAYAGMEPALDHLCWCLVYTLTPSRQRPRFTTCISTVSSIARLSNGP